MLILPYFGPFHDYFPFWLHSCGENRGTDWLVITDNPQPDMLPENVRWEQMTFEQLKAEFQKKFDFKLCLDYPYKLCDYKVYFGYLFESYLKDYDFWGYCDCDVIFGDLDRFLPESLFEQYDKIMGLGHLCFVRNTPQINTLFMKYDTYKIALTTPVIYGQDETITGYHLGFAGELMDQGYRFYPGRLLPADIDFRRYPFYVITSPEIPCVFTYEKGKLYQLTMRAGKIQQTERMYLHLQKRKMRVSEKLETDAFMVYPNVFAPINTDLLKSELFWEEVSQERPGYFSVRKERWNWWMRDVRRFLHEPRKIDCLRYRICGKKDSKNGC